MLLLLLLPLLQKPGRARHYRGPQLEGLGDLRRISEE
jgi:hypothetical protein